VLAKDGWNPSCESAKEDNVHFLLECPVYAGIRDEANKRVNSILSEKEIPVKEEFTSGPGKKR